MKILIKILISTILIFNISLAEEYSGFSIGYSKHIAEDPHDSGGTTYNSDPEENGFVIGYFSGERSNGASIETETTYYSEVSQKLTSDVTVDVSTFTSMVNLMATPGDGDYYGIFGAGIGFGYTFVDTNYKSGSTTFNGDEDTFSFAYQLILGFGSNNYELVFKRSQFGEVKGGSGKTSAGADYVADEFDNVYNSIVFKTRF
tara:strand:+ start:102 stop:707 length:606 start_codon:yes stop_codon:yes gene_type:complete